MRQKKKKKKKKLSSLHFAGGNRSEKLIALCDREVNKKSEGTLIEAATELIACSPGLLKMMKPTAQDSKLRRIVRLYIRDFGGNLAKGKKLVAKFDTTSWNIVYGLSFSPSQPDFEGFPRALRFPPSSKLTPTLTHLAVVLCSEVIYGSCSRAERLTGSHSSFGPTSLSCALCNLVYGLRERVISRSSSSGKTLFLTNAIFFQDQYKLESHANQFMCILVKTRT